MTKTQKITARLDSVIAKANGTGRQRLLGRAEVAQVITEAMRDDYGSTNGGSVAKAYSKHGNKALQRSLSLSPMALTISRSN